TACASASGTPSLTLFCNDQGHQTSQTDPDGVARLFQYNARAEPEYAATDMNVNRSIDFGGTDRITQTVRDVTTDNGANVYRTRTFVWATNGVNSSNLISMVEASVDGLQTWSTVWNNGVALTSHSTTTYPGGGY